MAKLDPMLASSELITPVVEDAPGFDGMFGLTPFGEFEP
jgi:hypothetical protein